MLAPKCRLCGVAEWNHVCSGEGVSEIERRAQGVTKPVTKRVTKGSHNVTKGVTGNASVTRCPHCAEYKAQLEMATSEIAMLKRRLAEQAGGRPAPMTSAERVRKMRAKRKTQPGERQDFEG